MEIKDMDDYHLKYGLHSNIPRCCIDFFIKSKKDSAYYKHSSISYRAGYDYVPCKKCLKKKKIVELHICEVDNPECDIFYNYQGNWKGKKINYV